MKISEAKSLISGAGFYPQKIWLDLGCGAGTFTYALAELLSAGSWIYAIDQTKEVLATSRGNTSIEFIQLDFVTDTIALAGIGGVLMANSLHFVKGREEFVGALIRQFRKPVWLIVEYESNVSNRWQPFPVPFNELEKMFFMKGYSKIEKVGTRKSVFGGEMYAAYIQP